MNRKNLGSIPGITPTPLLLVGTYDEEGQPSAMVAVWGVTSTWHIVELNLASDHKTTENITHRKAFTVSIVTKETLDRCDYLGSVSAKLVPDKLKRSGLAPYKSDFVTAPCFRELPLVMECELLRIDAGEDDKSVRVLGTIKNVAADQSILKEDGQTVDFVKLHPVVWDNFSGDYFAVGEDLGSWLRLGVKYQKEHPAN